MSTLLVGDGSVEMSAQPYFGRAVFRRHGNQWDVDDESKRDAGVVEVGVVVGGLRGWRGVGSWWEGGVAGDEAERGVGAKGGGSYLSDNRIWMSVRERAEVLKERYSMWVIPLRNHQHLHKMGSNTLL